MLKKHKKMCGGFNKTVDFQTERFKGRKGHMSTKYGKLKFKKIK